MANDTLQNETIRTNWQRGREAFETAKAAAEEYEQATFNPAWAKIDAIRGGKLAQIEDRAELETKAVPDWDAISDKMEALNERAYSDAEWQLLLTPAPDRDALEWKMDRLFGDADEYCDSIRMDAIAAFLADVRRLLDH